MELLHSPEKQIVWEFQIRRNPRKANRQQTAAHTSHEGDARESGDQNDCPRA